MLRNRTLKVLVLLSALCAGLMALLRWSPGFATWYSARLFPGLQRLRTLLFGWVSFSLGDVLYLLAALALLIAVGRWTWTVFHWRTYRNSLKRSLLRTSVILAGAYLLFLIGWGGTYYAPSLAQRWELKPDTSHVDSAMLRFDRLLIARLNYLAPRYKPLPISVILRRTQELYRVQSANPSIAGRIRVKPSLLGHAVPLLGTSGYYNPWTGEAQIDRLLPAFDLPFTACHEAAHQAGVASEGDANLLAYVVCTGSPDPSFQYSGYFNLWLYSHARVRWRDSVLAKSLETTLHPLPLAHRDTLRARNRRYAGPAEVVSRLFYDRYLRMNRHPAGLKSYGLVALSAWAYEARRPVRTRWYLP